MPSKRLKKNLIIPRIQSFSGSRNPEIQISTCFRNGFATDFDQDLDADENSVSIALAKRRPIDPVWLDALGTAGPGMESALLVSILAIVI